VRVHAFAKLNLSLQVLGRRADGYHELRTTFQSLALHDTITLTATSGPFTITCADPEIPRDQSNLIWRAAERLAKERRGGGDISGVHVALTKRVPSQAGLGGGSSDAAAVLRALVVLWRLRIGAEQLLDIAAALGADVPFFLEGGTVLGLDRGDVLYPLVDAPPAWVVLVVPDFGVSTRDAYAWWDQQSGAGRTQPTFTSSAGPHPRG